jgi:hypothetical protein
MIVFSFGALLYLILNSDWDVKEKVSLNGQETYYVSVGSDWNGGYYVILYKAKGITLYQIAGMSTGMSELPSRVELLPQPQPEGSSAPSFIYYPKTKTLERGPATIME